VAKPLRPPGPAPSLAGIFVRGSLRRLVIGGHRPGGYIGFGRRRSRLPLKEGAGPTSAGNDGASQPRGLFMASPMCGPIEEDGSLAPKA
jgi:hypothetical protein